MSKGLGARGLPRGLLLWASGLLFSGLQLGVRGSCPFQTPYWFKNTPVLSPVLDENGEVISDKVHVEWGEVVNLKCVDYFRIESVLKSRLGTEQRRSDPIQRWNTGAELTVIPCTEYTVRVAGYEDFRENGRNFKVYSNSVVYTLDYTPKFIKAPAVSEKKVTQRARGSPGRAKRGIYAYTTTPPPTTTEIFLSISVIWDLSFIDQPVCLDRVEFHYFNTEWEETFWDKKFQDPTSKDRLPFVITNRDFPCDPDFDFVTKVYGISGDFTNATWFPPSCVTTAPPPTTPAPTQHEVFKCHPGASFVFLYLFCT